MRKKIDIEGSVANIKAFLSIFNLKLEEKEINSIHDALSIYMDDMEVGKVEFAEKEIIIKTLSVYGDLECQTSYAEVYSWGDVEQITSLDQINAYTCWHNTFQFCLQLLNGNIFSGDLDFNITIDNVVGNRIRPHFILKYNDGEKEYDIKFQEDGFPFRFKERRGNFTEEITYSLFDTFVTGAYLLHSKSDIFMDSRNHYKYGEIAYIASGLDDDEMCRAVVSKKFNGISIVYDSREFGRISSDSQLPEEVIHKANYMRLVDPTVVERILKLIGEFSVDGHSFLEKMFSYGFNNYSSEEVYALFGIDKNNTALEEIYFGKKDSKSLERKK